MPELHGLVNKTQDCVESYSLNVKPSLGISVFQQMNHPPLPNFVASDWVQFETVAWGGEATNNLLLAPEMETRVSQWMSRAFCSDERPQSLWRDDGESGFS